MPWTDSAEGEGYAGQAEPLPMEGDGAKFEPWSRTCRQWFYRSPFVTSVLRQLDDFRENRLGPVQRLPAPLAHYLRVADAEFAKSKDYWEGVQLEKLKAGSG